jgi:hypothetical protein
VITDQQLQLAIFEKHQEENSMRKLFRSVAICAVGAGLSAFSLATAQTYTTVDYPGATATTLNGGPNTEGTSVGTYTDSAGVSHGFKRTAAGRLTAFDPPGSTATTPNFIDLQGRIVGGYLDGNGVSHGFVLQNGHYRNVDLSGAAGTVLTSINLWGEMTGFGCNSDPTCTNGPFTSFTLSAWGQFKTFNPPGSSNSQASVVNDLGLVVGAYADTGDNVHGYVLFNNHFITNDYPGGAFTFNGGLNLQGDIVGEYRNSDAVPHSFLLHNGHYIGFDPPGATASDATGINLQGTIVGLYADGAGAIHGFIRRP